MKHIIRILKQLCLYILLGICCGLCGALFSKAVSFVTNIRTNNDWLIFLLPFAGLLSVYLFKSFKTSNMGTNSVIRSCTENECISPLLAPSIFFCSVISHLFGASVGREGAALQIGGGLASLFNRLLKINQQQCKILMYCGMSGVFSAVFGTPLAAIAFAVQVVFVWKIYLKTILPLFITSFISYFTAKLLGAHAERFTINTVPDFTSTTLIKVLFISILTALVGLLFCYSLEFCEKIFEKYIKNPYLRIFTGGIITVLLTLIIGCRDYNGAGINIIEHIFTLNQLKPEAFILKIVFTCIAVASGFKGGEIVPSLFIGATFGALTASLIGLPIAIGAAVGMASLFCAVTKCPVSALFLSLEMFSGKGFIYMLFAVITAFAVSGKKSLYSAQNKNFTKNIFKNA